MSKKSRNFDMFFQVFKTIINSSNRKQTYFVFSFFPKKKRKTRYYGITISN